MALNEVCEQPWVKERDMVFSIPNFRESGKELRVTGQPIKLSETPAEVKLVFPRLGQHGDDILSILGYTQEDIVKLREQGIIG
jgi:crotonobetainyl-CoA:carnitine CoA-transferase CaiB-like acyl-CoA transferase